MKNLLAVLLLLLIFNQADLAAQVSQGVCQSITGTQQVSCAADCAETEPYQNVTGSGGANSGSYNIEQTTGPCTGGNNDCISKQLMVGTPISGCCAEDSEQCDSDNPCCSGSNCYQGYCQPGNGGNPGGLCTGLGGACGNLNQGCCGSWVCEPSTSTCGVGCAGVDANCAGSEACLSDNTCGDLGGNGDGCEDDNDCGGTLACISGVCTPTSGCELLPVLPQPLLRHLFPSFAATAVSLASVFPWIFRRRRIRSEEK